MYGEQITQNSLSFSCQNRFSVLLSYCFAFLSGVFFVPNSWLVFQSGVCLGIRTLMMFTNSWTIFFKLYIVFDLHSVSSFFITFEFLCISIFLKKTRAILVQPLVLKKAACWCWVRFKNKQNIFKQIVGKANEILHKFQLMTFKAECLKSYRSRET